MSVSQAQCSFSRLPGLREAPTSLFTKNCEISYFWQATAAGKVTHSVRIFNDEEWFSYYVPMKTVFFYFFTFSGMLHLK
jgi:hypothetical protein